MAETTESKTANTDEKPQPKRRGRPATAKPKAAPKSIQQAHEEDKPKTTAAKSTLPKVEGYLWTLDSATRTLYLHQPSNQYKGYSRVILEKVGPADNVLARTAELLIEEKAFADELFDLDPKITAVEELTV